MINDPMTAMLEDLQTQLRLRDTQIEHLKKLAETSVMNATTAAVQQTYIREVSKFHREALLPLLDVVKKIMERVSKEMPNASEYEASIVEIKKYLTRLEERAKGFEQQVFVDKARQTALEEQKKLEGNKEVVLGAPPRHGSRCAKTINPESDCDCALAKEQQTFVATKIGLDGERGEVKVHTTGELAAGTHADTCAKAHNHEARCDCHLASNYPPP